VRAGHGGVSGAEQVRVNRIARQTDRRTDRDGERETVETVEKESGTHTGPGDHRSTGQEGRDRSGRLDGRSEMGRSGQMASTIPCVAGSSGYALQDTQCTGISEHRGCTLTIVALGTSAVPRYAPYFWCRIHAARISRMADGGLALGVGCGVCGVAWGRLVACRMGWDGRW